MSVTQRARTLTTATSGMIRRLSRRATEGWYVRHDRPSEDRLRLLGCTYNANIIANLVGGSFWTGLLLMMKADDGTIGTMTIIGVAANMLQMFAPLFLERFSRRKPLIMWLRSALFVINILFIGLIPIFPAAQQARLTMLAIAVLAVNVLNAAISPGISIWHMQSIPPNVRTPFFTIITMTTGALVAFGNLMGSAVVDLFRAHGMEYAGLLFLRLVALGLAALDMSLYWKVTEYPYEPSPAPTLRELIVKPFREKLYLRTVAMTILWNISANIPGAYYTVYMQKNMGVSYTYLNFISFLNVPIVLLLTPVWRRVLTRFGWFRTLYTSMGLYLIYLVGLAFVTKQSMVLYPISLIWAFLMAGGINLSFTGIPYVNMPKKNQTIYIGFYSTAANFAALIGVTIGKYFIIWTEGHEFTLLGLTMINKQYLMLLTAVVMALCAVGIRRIHKTTPESDS